MRYTVYSGCAKEMVVFTARFRKHPKLYKFFQIISFPLAVGCTLGEMAATLLFVGGPWEIIRRYAATEYYWLVSVVYMTLIALFCGLFAVNFWRHLTWNRIDVDAIAALAGSALAVWYIWGTA